MEDCNAGVKNTKPKKWKTELKNDFIANIDNVSVNKILYKIIDTPDYEVNELANDVCKVLLTSAEKTFPNVPRKGGSGKKHKHFIYDKNTNDAKKRYYMAKRRFRLTKHNRDYEELVKQSKSYKKAARKAKLKAEKQFHQKLRNLKSTCPKAYWELLKVKKDKDLHTVSELLHHFKELSKTTGDYDVQHLNDTDIGIERNGLDITLLDASITEQEIRKAVKKMKNCKSCGIDNVSNEYIKASLDLLMPVYVHLFNKVLENGTVPADWLTGLIVPIYKNKGDITDPNNYRGITLLSCIGKLFTSILNERLYAFVETNNILSENQTGFRKGYGTNDHIFLLKCIVDLFCQSKQKLFCAFIDYAKAFDTIWREALWLKLHSQGIIENCKIHRVIKNMYSHIKSCIFVNGQKSEYFVNNLGVRQGENLSPLLFSLYINDLETFLADQGNASIDMEYELGSYMKLFALLYADDTVIIAKTAAELQKALNDISDYCKKWKLTVNDSKTKVIIFGNRKTNPNRLNFTYEGNALEIVDNFKYLGILFNFNGNFNKCKKALVDQASRAMFSLLSKSIVLNLPLDVVLDLFDKTIYPILTYGCEIWGYGNIQVIERLHLKFCKYLLKLKSSTPNCMVYGELGRTSMSVLIKSRMIGYWARLITGKESKLSYKMYKKLLELYRNNVYKSEWMDCISKILNDCGLGYVFMNQDPNMSVRYLTEMVKNILTDQFKQQWYAEINGMDKCVTYRTFKTILTFENYLVQLPKNIATPLVKFRTSNHKLPVETGRYTDVVHHLRHCNLCDDAKLGDEYHVMLECKHPTLVDKRQKYIPIYYRKRPNMLKFTQLLENCSGRNQLGLKVGLLSKEIMKLAKR
jgi:hypothetical protein